MGSGLLGPFKKIPLRLLRIQGISGSPFIPVTHWANKALEVQVKKAGNGIWEGRLLTTPIRLLGSGSLGGWISPGSFPHPWKRGGQTIHKALELVVTPGTPLFQQQHRSTQHNLGSPSSGRKLTKALARQRETQRGLPGH